MKMNFLVSLVLGLIAGGACYLVSENVYAGAGVGAGFFILLAFFVSPMLDRFKEKNLKRHECYQFINSFIVTLSVTKSLDRAYESGMEDLGPEAKKLNASISELNPSERVEYLASYFEQGIYGMFVSIVSIYIEQGGDVLSLSSELLAELTRIEETELSVISTNRKNVVEFISLWAMSLAIVLFMRFGLSTFYGYLKGSTTYLVALLSFFFLLGISLAVYFSNYTGEKLIVCTKRKRRSGKKQ